VNLPRSTPAVPQPSLWRRLRAVAAIVALFAFCAGGPAFGSGEERTTNGDDLIIRSDTHWAGGAEGGYLPIRVRVTNHGAPRDLAFEFDPTFDNRGIRVRRVIGVDQNATVHFTLSVPLVESGDGSLHVFEGSRLLTAHTRSISIPSAMPMQPSPPAMLVVSSAPVDCGRFVEAANHLIATGAARAGGGMGTVDSSILAEVVQSSMLPESWIDYTGLDFFAISRDELERLERPVRAALLKWVQCGGNLLVYEVGKESQALSRLDRLIEAPAQPTAWQNAVPTERPSGEIIDVSEEEAASGLPRPTRSGAKRESGKPTKGLLGAITKAAESPWPGGKEAFHHRDLMLGTVYAFAGNPFPGTINDWMWLCNSCGQGRWSWTTRQGTSPHIGTKDFFKFMNPGIQGVPTVAFLVLITVFSVVIGPINYVYLARRKMLWLLLLTVPMLALTTSALLVGYSVAAHGFAIKSRIRSLTTLDQRNQTEVTMARLALFAGLSPSGGLRFSPETAVYPVVPPTNQPTGEFVDWTQTQNLVSGWLPARTRTQFFTIRNAEQRSRVELKPAVGKTADFSNGLPWELEMVVVADDAGKLYIGRSVPAGGTVSLSEPSDQDLGDFASLLRRNTPAFPVGFVEPTPGYYRGGRRLYSTFSRYSDAITDFSANLMERRIAQWTYDLPRSKGLAPRSYLAVLRENPGVETGVPSTTDQMSLHLLNGYF
jgi:hypothetical protein